MHKGRARAVSVTLREYIAEGLKTAVYEKGEALNVIVAEVPRLRGCVTQGETIEQARENLIDAIEVWIMAGLLRGEEPPVINGLRLAISAGSRRGRPRGQAQPHFAS